MKKVKLVIFRDDEEYNDPRQWDNLTKMVCFHRNYNLGDKHNYNKKDYSGWKEVEKAIKEKENVVLIKPLFLYDHSGITISTSPFACKWDSGQVGFVYITKENIEKIGITDQSEENLNKIMLQEVKTYDNYIRGDVYGYSIIEEIKCPHCGSIEENIIDSCGGFIEDDWNKLIQDMKMNVEDKYHHLFDKKQRWDIE